MARADELLANRYLLDPFPIVRLPARLTWAEDPFHDSNWQFQFQTLRFTLDLFNAAAATGTTAYSDRALFLLKDWMAKNPRSKPASRFAWNNHSTAWRAVVYACAAELTPMRDWLHDALVLHGRTLADPDFYVGHGNHALNQSIGLLEVGHVLGRDDWTALARDRINTLVKESVDSQGVTNEQAVGYQSYNYKQYGLAQRRLEELGLTPGDGFARVDLMPRFLAQATLPNHEAEMIGDTGGGTVGSVPDTWMEFVATEGASGPTPPLVAAYRAGYLFARSGWGTDRAFRDETFLSLRWGPGERFHGHADGTSLTLYSWGSRLLVDPGKYTYTKGSWRTFFTGRRAHNVVTVDGAAFNSSLATRLLGRTTTSRLVDVRLESRGFAGVIHRRRVTWSRKLDYILVEDRLLSSRRHTYRQLWHLVEHPHVVLGATTARTRRDRGNVLISELIGKPRMRVVSGDTKPIQGWISYRYRVKVAAPVVQAVRSGSNVRYLTLIVPAARRPRVEVGGLTLTPSGYRVTITIGGRSERVVAHGPDISISTTGGG